ncbi:MAG: WecB/TagA/CpsF family glycosyltransferase, partial [Candidatus Jordarchaeum sp.]|uniref:WecB/TagA/CpsF family glycosyltransferase n=1 Tax=Candidatus Jordarchaeum sp. TaxID=2823881 RepID=UPI0040492F5D
MKEPIYLLGIKICPVSLSEAIVEVLDKLPRRNGEYFCFPDIHVIMQGFRDPYFRDILNNSSGNFPDGMGVVWALKMLKKARFKGRVRGVDFFKRMCEHAAKKNFTVFLYGNSENTLVKLKDKLKETFNSIDIVGAISPPYRPLTIKEDNEIVKQINDVNPDILFVSLGAPKQEKWMAEHRPKIKALQFGVGAAFDFFTGRVKQPPSWIQQGGFEWL